MGAALHSGGNGMGGIRRAISTCAVGLVLATAATAQTGAPAKDWEVRLQLHGWVSATHADVSAGDVSTSLDLDYGDVIEGLKWALQGATEVRWRRALLLLDLNGSQLAVDGDAGARSFPVQLLNAGPGGTISVGPVDASTRTTLWIVDLKGGWRVLDAPLSRLLGDERAGDPRRFQVDLLAGVRYWNANVDVEVDVAPATLTVGGTTVPVSSLDLSRVRAHVGDLTLPGNLVRGGSRRAESRTDWFDPIAGLRISADVLESVSLFTLGDMGGFGLGEASGLTWQAMAGIEWRFARHFSVNAAYRALAIDRAEQGVVEDAVLHGPQLGFGVRF